VSLLRHLSAGGGFDIHYSIFDLPAMPYKGSESA
jgi:hypothetical protein